MRKANCRGCEDRDLIIASLKRDLKELRGKLEWFETKAHPTMVTGIRGEKLVVKITGGWRTPSGWPHDIKMANGQKVEVKTSKIGSPHRSRSASRRWTWGKILGAGGRKDFDWILLLGEKDRDYQGDDNDAYVYFILNKDDIRSVITNGGNIHLNIDPRTTRSPSGMRLWKQFRTKSADMPKFWNNVKALDSKI